MKRHLSATLIAALLVAIPAVLRADTIYYREPGKASIQSVSGTIVKEAGGFMEIATTDGRTISIPQNTVFQIVRGSTPDPRSGSQSAPSSPTHSPYSAPAPAAATSKPADVLDEYHGTSQFPAAAAAARGASFEESHPPAIKYHYGFKGGLTSSNVRAEQQEFEDSGSLRGYAFGFWWGVPVVNRLSVQAEALFSMRGDSESEAGYNYSTRLGYFDLPILGKLNFFPDAAIQPSFFAGPSLGFNVSAHSKLEGESGEADIDVKDRVGTVDFGLAIGGGLDFRRGGRTFGVDVRYIKGLSNVADGANGSAHNESIAIMGSIGLK